MIFKTTLTLLLFLFFSVSQAEIVKELVINGNKRVSDETIKIYGEIEVNKNLAEKDTNKILNNLYKNSGLFISPSKNEDFGLTLL